MDISIHRHTLETNASVFVSSCGNIIVGITVSLQGLLKTAVYYIIYWYTGGNTVWDHLASIQTALSSFIKVVKIRLDAT